MKINTQHSQRDYQEFRTGYSYADIYQMLRYECEQGKRRHVTRHTVLGKWHEIKLSMFEAIKAEYGNG